MTRRTPTFLLLASAAAVAALVALLARRRRRDARLEDTRLEVGLAVRRDFDAALGGLAVEEVTKLDLGKRGLTQVPRDLARAVALRELNLGGNDLVTLPDFLEKLAALQILFVSGARRMAQVPRVLGRMKALTRLGLKSNGIAKIADDAIPPNVQHLILTDNVIRELPVKLCDRLLCVRKLMLAGNQLASLPAEISKLENLELIRLANNQLAAVPPELLELPKLAWVALAGNPMCPPLPAPTAKVIRKEEVALGEEKLGEGASSTVWAGTYLGDPVAVKVFKEVSSDGRPEDEVALYASLAHPHLVAVRGVQGDGAAIVLERLPATTVDLAKPPTIHEVIEDRYEEGTRFAPAAAQRLLVAVASALEYLHAEGVAHGDVYGHNTMTDADARCVRLVDFGAAWKYRDCAVDARLVERCEVRAFGVLAAEVSVRTQPAYQEHAVLAEWCKSAERPATFESVVSALANSEEIPRKFWPRSSGRGRQPRSSLKDVAQINLSPTNAAA